VLFTSKVCAEAKNRKKSTPENLVSSACYDKQEVRAYLLLFSRSTS